MTGFEEMMRKFYARASAAIRARQEGQTFVEYALVLALVAVGVAGALVVLGTHINGVYQQINTGIQAALP
jgi:Flp pilus assembly pilin Flp